MAEKQMFEVPVQMTGTMQVAGDVVAVQEWNDGQRTGNQATNREGVPLWNVPVLMQTKNFGKRVMMPVTVMVASEKEPCAFGDLVSVVGATGRIAKANADHIEVVQAASDDDLDSLVMNGK